MKEWNEKIAQIAKWLKLELYPQAVKMVEKTEDIPEGVIMAGEKYGHLAYCQAQALAKREGKTVYMDKRDHWCWASLVGFGHVDCRVGTKAYDALEPFLGIKDPEKRAEFWNEFPVLPYGKYIGTVVGPAQTANYEPDVILINCNDNFQLRTLFRAVKNQTGKMLNFDVEAIDSCIYTIVVSMLTGEYTMAVPDPGEQERALADKHEMIFCLPFSRLDELYRGCQSMLGMPGGIADPVLCMEYDYPRPPFYNRLFEIWGMDTGKEWQFADKFADEKK